MEKQATENEQATRTERREPTAGDRLMYARMETLLERHFSGPTIEAMRAREEPESFDVRFAVRAGVLAGYSVHRRFPDWSLRDYVEGPREPVTAGSRAMRRNERLLMRLVFRGLKARGEWPVKDAGEGRRHE